MSYFLLKILEILPFYIETPRGIAIFIQIPRSHTISTKIPENQSMNMKTRVPVFKYPGQIKTFQMNAMIVTKHFQQFVNCIYKYVSRIQQLSQINDS